MIMENVIKTLKDSELLAVEYEDGDCIWLIYSEPISVVINNHTFKCQYDGMTAFGIVTDPQYFTLDICAEDIDETGIGGMIKFYVDDIDTLEIKRR